MPDPSWLKFAPKAVPAGAPSKAEALPHYKERSGDTGATLTTPAFCRYYDEILENMRQQVEPIMLQPERETPPRGWPPQQQPQHKSSVFLADMLQKRAGGTQPSYAGGGGGGSSSGLFARPTIKQRPEAESSMSVVMVVDVAASVDELNLAGVTKEKLRPVEAACIPLTPSPGCLLPKSKAMFEAIRRTDATAFMSHVSASHISLSSVHVFH